MVQISSTGASWDTIAITWPDELANALHIYNRGNGNGFYVTGYFSDSTALTYENKCFVAEVNDGSIQYFRHGARWHGGLDGLGFVDDDGSLVYGRYSYQDFWVGDFKFHAMRHCPGIGLCDSLMVLEQIGVGRFHACVPDSQDGIIAIMPQNTQDCGSYYNALVHLTGDLSVSGGQPIPSLGTGAWGASSDFDDNLSALMLPSGNLLLCGMYERIMSPDWWHPVAIQRLSPTGILLDTVKFFNTTNPAITMRPGISRGMSAFDESTFAFAYADFAWQSGPWPYSNETSNIHVLKMDTALNILGEYVFNGDAINRYHFLVRVVATADGAVYVMGSVYDYDADDPMPKAWVARIGPEQFVSVPEAAQAGFSMFPNPGSEGFNLRMANQIGGAVARLHDAQGLLVHEHPLSDAQTWIDADALPPGLYLVQVTARDGSRFSARWVKE